MRRLPPGRWVPEAVGFDTGAVPFCEARKMVEDASRHQLPGATVVRRDVYGGAVWSATPQRVIQDGPGGLLVAYWPGVRSLAPALWVQAQGSSKPRTASLESLAAGRWELVPWTWRESAVLTAQGAAGAFYSVSRFYGSDGVLDRWYVNFERPARVHGVFVDTFDLLLDLVASPDLDRWQWKDEEEFGHGCRLGVVSEAERRAVEAARGEVVGLLEQQAGPFAAGAQNWSPAAAWAAPVLPAGAADVEAAAVTGD